MKIATKRAAKKFSPKPKARLTKAQRVANFAKLLRKIGACAPARRFCKGKTIKEAWAQSPNQYWMTFLFACLHDVGGAYGSIWKMIPSAGMTPDRSLCERIAAKFPIESFAFYKERGL